jgi:hypothetical protein
VLGRGSGRHDLRGQRRNTRVPPLEATILWERVDADSEVSRVLREDGRIYTFRELFEGWVHAVGRVEEGYSLTIYDYVYEIFNRAWLDEAIEAASPPLRAELLSLVVPIDDRFDAATAPRPHEFQLPAYPARWRRIPKKLVGELKEDLTR